MERTKPREIIKTGAVIGAGILALGFLATFGFSNRVKEEARERQKGLCPVCGQPLCICHKVEGHHRLPKCRNGNNSSENCVMVHGSPGHDCHEGLDRKAVDHGLIYMPDTNSFVPISEAPATLFKNERARESAIRQFEHIVLDPIERCVRKHREKQRRRKKGYRGQGGRRR